MGEMKYRTALIKRIEKRFPGVVIIKNDASQLPGIPDLLLLYETHWAMLEVKANEHAPIRPNQPHYVMKFNEMSFAAFIYPENEEHVLDALQRSFLNRGATCIP